MDSNILQIKQTLSHLNTGLSAKIGNMNALLIDPTAKSKKREYKP